MKLTDERIREMFDAWFDPDDNGNYWDCFLDAYRMAEAEATKPQEQQEYGCYCELGPDDEPDSCVIGTGREGVTK